VTADSEAARQAVRTVPGIPRDTEGPVFREPWEAQAFALALALQERGLFTWGEWAAALGEEIRRAQAAGDPDTGDTYYRHWLAALERVAELKGLTDTAALARYRDAWDHAADRTPHGDPIELRPEDFPPVARPPGA
jgi:nitrile hydratase accessory protein